SAILNLAATAHARARKVETGLALVSQAIDHVESTGERWCEAEVYRVRGELLVRQLDGQAKRKRRAGAAEQWMERALHTARQQGAKLWELRAAVSLARLRHEQGRRAEARALLQPLDASLPEQPGSRDLEAARMLWERLRD